MFSGRSIRRTEPHAPNRASRNVMTIECPECHMPATVEPEDIQASGTRIQCGHCGFSFLVRSYSHEGGGQQESAKPEGKEDLQEGPAREPFGTRPGQESGFLQGLPLEALLARDEVPYAVVQAHQVSDERRAAARSASLHGEGSTARDIPIHGEGAIPQPADGTTETLKKETLPESPLFSLQRRMRSMRRMARPGWGRAFRWAGLFLVAGLLAGVLLYFRPFPNIPWDALKTWSSKIRTFLPGRGRDTGSIQFSDLNSYFVPGGRGQTGAFVIEGNVTNHHATACKFIQVKGTLFDGKGDRAAEQTAYCGNILKRQEIQSSTPDRIREILQRPSGASLSNLSIEPGKSIPFMLVFPDPPENVSEFSVEILGYQKEELPEQREQPPGPADATPGAGPS